jgi:HAE1 family hydrophobic/amphiphilic exporter-1
MTGRTTLVDRPVLITVVVSLLVLLGTFLAFQLSVALFPEISAPIVVVTTSYPSAGPETVEKTVTKTLESTLINVSNLSKLTSTSSDGSSQIMLTFGYGSDLTAATNDIRDKISSVKAGLPSGAKDPQIFKLDPNSQPILQIAVRGSRSAEELRQIGEDIIQPALQRLNGVSEASVSGGRTKVVRVDVHQDRLDAYQLTLTTLSGALAQQNVELGGGKITEGSRNYSVRTVGEFASVAEVAQVIVANRNGQVIRLGDVADVTQGYRDEDSSVFLNGTPGVYVGIKKQSGGNTVKVATAVKAALPALEKQIPSDVKLEIVSDDTTQISSTVDTLIHAAFEAILFSMLVIFLFLRSARTTLVIGLSIPISFAITLMAMSLLGLTLNIFTMTGLILGVGMIVDDSIVIMENIVRYRERGMKNRMAAILGSQEMRNAVLASTLTTVMVFVPILLMQSQLEIIGILFKDMIFTIVISLLTSLAVALFVVPVLVTRYFPLANRHETPIKNKALAFGDKLLAAPYNALEKGYRWLLSWSLRHRWVVIVTVIALFVFTINQVGSLKFTFSPAQAENTITLNLTLPVGTTLAETKEVLRQLEEDVKAETKGIQTLIRTAGSGGSGAFSSSSGTNKGSLKVVLPPKKEQISTGDDVKAILRKHYGDFPAATFSFSAGFNISGTNAPIDVMVQSDDLTKAVTAAQQIVDVVKTKVAAATEVKMDLDDALPELAVKIDRQRAYSLGVNLQSVATEVAASIGGVTATTYREGGKDLDVLVVLQASDRQKVPDLNKITVLNSQGARVPLANIATLDRTTGPVEIKRENKARTIHVTASVRPGSTVPEVQASIQKAVGESVVLDSDVHVSYTGDFTALLKMAQSMLIVLIMAILLVFGVMAGQYESFRNPIINLFTLPLMVIGVVGIYLITGQTASLFSAVGLVMLVGLVVKNGIVMIDYTGLLLGRGLTADQAALEAGVARLRPVLMTSLTAILGMIPLAFNSGEGGELVQPIGLTVIGGLSSATLMTLLFIPVMYSIFNRKKAPKAPKKSKEASHEAA